MFYTIKWVFQMFVCMCLTLTGVAFSQDTNEAVEPAVAGQSVIDLLEGDTLDAWKLPSDNWSLKDGIIIGNTGKEELETPEWLYTKQRFSDFEFTCELRLTGDHERNTGIYYRVNTIIFKGHGDEEIEDDDWNPFEAPSGYEFDASFHHTAEENYWGSLGDWYARPSLRIFADQDLIKNVYMPAEWNRMTIRARGNRLEYWINGIKVMDYVDPDPEGSREGIIGFQIHDGAVMKVEYRNIRVLPLE